MKKIKKFLYDHTDALVIFFATFISVVSFVYFYHKGYILLYADASSHLDTARRVIDSLTPGLVQLGTVWLPLQHLLMLPLIWNDYLWHTGVAGSIISMISFIVTVYFTYKIAAEYNKSKLSGIVAASVIALNVNFVYLQVTPMTEPLLLAIVSITYLYLLRWTQTFSLSYLMTAAFFTMLSTLTRYEGWLFAVFNSIYIFWVSLKKKFI